jgi:hypothetical protein
MAVIDKFKDGLHRVSANDESVIAIPVGDKVAVGQLLVTEGVRFVGRFSRGHPLRKPSVSPVPFPVFASLKSAVSFAGQNPRQCRYRANQGRRPISEGIVMLLVDFW